MAAPPVLAALPAPPAPFQDTGIVLSQWKLRTVMRWTRAPSVTELPEFYQRLSMTPIGQVRPFVESAIALSMDSLGYSSPMPVSQNLSLTIVGLLWSSIQPDDLAFGLNIFRLGPLGLADVERQRQLNSRADIVDGGALRRLTDTVLDTDLCLPKSTLEFRSLLERLHAVFHALLGSQHPLVSQLAIYHATLLRLELRLQQIPLIAILLARRLQLDINYWLEEQESMDLLVALPDFCDVFRKIRLRVRWEPVIPSKYLQPLPAAAPRPCVVTGSGRASKTGAGFAFGTSTVDQGRGNSTCVRSAAHRKKHLLKRLSKSRAPVEPKPSFAVAHGAAKPKPSFAVAHGAVNRPHNVGETSRSLERCTSNYKVECQGGVEQHQTVLTPQPVPITSSPVIKPSFAVAHVGPVSKPSFAVAHERPSSAVAYYGPQRAEVDTFGQGNLTCIRSVAHPEKHLLQRLSKSRAPEIPPAHLQSPPSLNSSAHAPAEGGTGRQSPPSLNSSAHAPAEGGTGNPTCIRSVDNPEKHLFKSRARVEPKPKLGAELDTLGKKVRNEAASFEASSSPGEYFRNRQGRGDLTGIDSVTHPAKHLLQRLSKSGAPVVLSTEPWSPKRIDEAIRRGPHKSALEHLEFLRGEMADMVDKAFWSVLPYDKVRNLKNLRISPIGVVPQHDRRPRTIVDYSFSDVNKESVKLAPKEAMQFGRTLERLLTKIVYADPRFGPVKFIKIDIADGFYRVWVRVDDIPKLGVAFPSLEGEEPIVAFPLALPMGWTESPPYFCSLTETIADTANHRILKWQNPSRHRLEADASSPGDDPRPKHQRQQPASTALAIPQTRNPLLPNRQRILAAVDVFVDDFIAVGQGSPQRLHRLRRILMTAIDDILRPVDANDPSHRKEPISVKKLRQGDANWDTIKTVLGWVIDSVAMTISLPQRRAERLVELLDSIKPDQKRLSVNTWHQLLGELRSMSLALPGTRGLFSSLQAAITTRRGNRLRLTKRFHQALDDFRWIQSSLTSRPTRMQELVPTPPSIVGTHDASGYAAGGVWFPHPTVDLRPVPLQLIGPSGKLTTTTHTQHVPIVWRHRFPSSIQANLVTFKNPNGTINNSELELAGSLINNDVSTSCYDIRERTSKSDTDNLTTLYWHRKGSITSTSPAATLLRLQGLHQRFHRYVSLKDYVPGKQNQMADDASRLTKLDDLAFLDHFNSTYPQEQPWHLFQPAQEITSLVSSALHRKMCSRKSLLRHPKPPINCDSSARHSTADWSPILLHKSSPAPAPTPPTATISSATPITPVAWHLPYATLSKRPLLWGPRPTKTVSPTCSPPSPSFQPHGSPASHHHPTLSGPASEPSTNACPAPPTRGAGLGKGEFPSKPPVTTNSTKQNECRTDDYSKRCRTAGEWVEGTEAVTGST